MVGRALPLAGVTVLDLSRVLAGPYCSLLLADMGAEVIKIEKPDGGDDSRQFSLPNVDGHSVYFLTMNRNKKSVALDLKQPEARDAFLKMVAGADIVLENFRTGVMERLGLGYDTLRALKPSLVYCAISGYGRDGPNVDVPGYDPVAQAESGLMSMTGEPDGAAMRTGPSIVDMVCGMFAAQAITAALRSAERTGEGRFVEASLHETGLNMLLNFAGSYLMTGVPPTRAGNTNQVAQPAGVYEAEDGPIMVTAGTNDQFRRLCRDVLERPALAEDARFLDNPSRVANVTALKAALSEVFVTRPRTDWVARLRAAEVPAGGVVTVAEALDDELVAARGSVRQLTHSALGTYPALKAPIRLHDSEELAASGAPLLGEHTRDVLIRLAGMEPTAIDDLVARGIACEAEVA